MEHRPSKTAGVNRRRFLRAGGLAGAPAGPASQAAWEVDWEKLVAAAKQEGRVNVVTAPGPNYLDSNRESMVEDQEAARKLFEDLLK